MADTEITEVHITWDNAITSVTAWPLPSFSGFTYTTTPSNVDGFKIESYHDDNLGNTRRMKWNWANGWWSAVTTSGNPVAVDNGTHYALQFSLNCVTNNCHFSNNLKVYYNNTDVSLNIIEAGSVEKRLRIDLWVATAPVVNYNLWVGNTQVTSANKDNVLGDNKVSFNPETNTLSFDNATINTYSSIESEKNYDKLNAAIRSKLDTLIISGNVNLPVETYSIYATDDIITSWGNLVVNGNINNYGELRIFGDLNVISWSIISSTHGSIWCYSNLIFGSNVSMIDLPHGIHANSITLESPLWITSPANWEIVHSSSWYEIGDYSTRAVVQPVTKITNINISWITNPVLWENPTTSGLTITSTPENAINLDTELVPSWRAEKNDYRNRVHADGNYSRYRPPFNNEPEFYFLRIIFTPANWYSLAENYTVTADSWYDSILTWVSDLLLDTNFCSKNSDWLNYIHIRYLAQNIPSPTTTISNINLSGTASISVWDNLESVLEVENIDDPNNSWYGYSSYSPIKWNWTAWVDVDSSSEATAVDWTNYWIKVTLNIEDWFALATNPTLTYNWKNFTASGHTLFENNILYIDLWTATASTPTTYTITWKNWNDTLKEDTVNAWETPSYNWTTPTKAEDSSCTYIFKWWNPEVVAATGDATYTATFTCKSKSTWWGWGGWWGKTVTKTDTKTDEAKAEENKSEEKQESNTENPENTQNDSQKVLEDGLTQEFHDAYDFAYKNGITTMPTAKDANMNGPLTRIAMAKMLSNYAINILWKKPANKVVPKFPDIDEKLNEDYGWAVDLAYQLWIMWIWIENFRPYDLVPRAEFATALSRMLYWTADWEWAYYETHLKQLKEKGIITNDDPNLQEARWYVMIMLMRSAK